MKLLWTHTLHCSSPAAASQPVSHGCSLARVPAVSDCHRGKSIGFVLAPKNASLVQRTLLWRKARASQASRVSGLLPAGVRFPLLVSRSPLDSDARVFLDSFPVYSLLAASCIPIVSCYPPAPPPTHTTALPVHNVERPRGGELAAAFRVDFARGQAAFGRTKAFSFLGRWAAAAADPKEAVFRAYHPRAQHPAPPPAPPAAGPDLRTATGSRQAARTQPATSLGCARCQRHERNECTK